MAFFLPSPSLIDAHQALVQAALWLPRGQGACGARAARARHTTPSGAQRPGTPLRPSHPSHCFETTAVSCKLRRWCPTGSVSHCAAALHGPICSVSRSASFACCASSNPPNGMVGKAQRDSGRSVVHCMSLRWLPALPEDTCLAGRAGQKWRPSSGHLWWRRGRAGAMHGGLSLETALKPHMSQPAARGVQCV